MHIFMKKIMGSLPTVKQFFDLGSIGKVQNLIFYKLGEM